MLNRRRKFFWAGWVLVVFLAPLLATACDVPVFRYALERWPPDAYELLIFHKSPLTTNQQALLEAWGKVAEDGLANLMVEKIDLAKELPKPMQALWKAQTNAVLPWLVVLYPRITQLEAPVWAGPLEADEPRTLVDSSARRELVKRLSKGETAVWLLLESGDKKTDDAAAQLLEAESRKLEKSLQLPEAAAEDPRVSPELPLKIAFSTVRLSRSNPAERMLRNMLLHVDPEMVHVTEPMVYGIFGRGRALPPFIGKDISAEVVTEVADFLTGACSCQVKSMNPGFDLLLVADWEASLEGRVVKDPELPPLIGMAQFLAAPNTNPPVAANSTPAPESTNHLVVASTTPGNLGRNLRLALIFAVAGLVLGTVFLKFKYKGLKN